MIRTYLNIAMGAAVAVLTFVSFVIILQGAHDEPYETFRPADAFAQIVVGTALISVWFCRSVAIVALVIARQMSKLWLITLSWAAICMLYLSECPLGYLYDLEHFIIPYAGNATGK